LLATVEGTGETAKTYLNITDHLGSVTAVVDLSAKTPDMVKAETADYYPFGEIRANTKSEARPQAGTRKYLGQEFDTAVGLNYLNARYYNGTIAKFLSPDPVSTTTPEQILQDPQQLNLYSYARNNPLIYKDDGGEKV